MVFNKIIDFCFDTSGRIEANKSGIETFVYTSEAGGRRLRSYTEELWIKNEYACPNYDKFMRLGEPAPSRFTAADLKATQ